MNADRGSASALRRVAKRRAAFASASPFMVATVAFADAFIYCKGVLCYTLDDKLRILDLHHSSNHETVVSIPGLLSRAISEIADNNKGTFEVLYYSHGIVSCLYQSSCLDAAAWLIAFDLGSRTILLAEDLTSTERIFVRHNRQFLYYGTHSEVDRDGHKKWVLRGYDFRKRKWFEQKVHLPDMVGSEIGSTICFEFHQGDFYALSNQTSFEVEEIDWTSFYHCVRFPLASPSNELLEKTENKHMWRRQHQEGPIDDRWTCLRLDEDEKTGKLRIIESRKEWYHGSSSSERTYYTTDLVFPDRSKDLDEYTFALNTTSFVPDSTSSSPGIGSSCNASGSSALVTTSFDSSSNLDTDERDLSSLPDDPILRLLRKGDHPHHIRPPPRLPQNTHPGNDGSSKQTFTLAKSRIRYYHTSASTFIDLVDDPLPTDWQGRQRLRLRAGSRRLGSPLRYPSSHPSKVGLLREPPSDLTEALRQMYKYSEIQYWPAAQNPDQMNEGLDDLYRLLNPPTHLGNVEGICDERSLVYATGGYDKPQAIIFISFDPAIRLTGVQRWHWGRMGIKGVGEGAHVDGRATGSEGEGGKYGYGHGEQEEDMYVDVGEGDRTVVVDRKGKGKGKMTDVSAQQGHGGREAYAKEIVAPSSAESQGRSTGTWAWREKAMYQDIGLGYNFGL